MTDVIEPSKEKIAKADYMLLYIRINQVHDEYNAKMKQPERIFKFEHVKNRFAPADHIWSIDKNAVTHCYRQLEQGQYYMIFAHRVHELTEVKKDGKAFSRWIWRYALPMTEKQIRLAYDFYCKNSSDAKLCGQYADQLVNPQIAPKLEEFDYE